MSTFDMGETSTNLYYLTGVDGRIRYIGKTVRSLKKRLSSHISEARCGHPGHRQNWIRAQGYQIEIHLIETVQGGGSNEEKALIKGLRGLGLDLVNRTEGGEGVIPTPELRLIMSERGKERFQDPIFREKHAQAMAVRNQTNEEWKRSVGVDGKRRAARTRCNRGHPFTPENTAIKTKRGKPYRDCRECSRANERKRYWEKKDGQ